jgi:predicted AlkP superfamily phosphohydrolase/phosphomutase
MTDGTKTLLFGLDGACFKIFNALIEAGVTPFIGELRDRGMAATLMSTVNPLTPPAWTTVMTGCNPGNHGIYDFIRAEERGGSVFFAMNSSRDRRVETLWEIVSRQGMRTTALNFFGLAPPRPVAGHTISGFVPYRHLRRAMYPPELYEKIQSLPGFNRHELAMDLDLEKKSIQGLPEKDYKDWIGLHRRREQQWFEITQMLMQDDPSDLTAIVFDGVDKLQHVFWRYLDPDIFDPATASPADLKVREMCLDYYRDVDGYMRRLAEIAGPEARQFVVSDHGFGPTWEVFYLNVWLAERGYLAWQDESEHDDTGALTVDRLKSHVGMLDWARTTAFCLTPSSNGVTIRRAEAGASGVSADEYEALRRQIAQELLDWRDPATGEQVVTSVITREEAYPGQVMEMAPDLLLTIRDSGFVSILNAKAPLLQRKEILGTHRPEGVFLAAGPGIETGESKKPIALADVTPMMLHSLGLPVPVNLDGAVPAGVFTSEFLARRPVESGPPTLTPDPFPEQTRSREERALDAEAESEVMERLKALGYLE